VAADAQLSNGKGDVTLTLAYSLGSSVPLAGQEIADSAGMCVDDPGNSPAPRTRIEPTIATAAPPSSGPSPAAPWCNNGLCLNDKGSGGVGSPVVLYPCTGLPNELWTHNTSGEYVCRPRRHPVPNRPPQLHHERHQPRSNHLHNHPRQLWTLP